MCASFDEGGFRSGVETGGYNFVFTLSLLQSFLTEKLVFGTLSLVSLGDS